MGIADEQSAGWNIAQWCESISVSRASFYLLADKPKTVKIGRRHVVIESPHDYLNRIAKQSEARRDLGPVGR